MFEWKDVIPVQIFLCSIPALPTLIYSRPTFPQHGEPTMSSF
jgi:hypothetical protein